MTKLSAELQLTMLNAATNSLGEIALIRGNNGPEDRVDPNGVTPPDVARFLARLRLLEGVPFNYLVPDAAMLPMESIRFFYVDRNWLDALVQGALSVGTLNSSDREKLTGLYPIVRNEVDLAERMVRLKDADLPAVDGQGRPLGAAGPMTGFLLRSKLVSGWPGLHVRAYSTDTRPDNKTIPDMDTSPDRVRLLRMERLAPAVLLVLFDGVPAVVHLEEPRSGIQFGIRLSFDDANNSASAVLPIRNVDKPNDGFLQTPGNQDRTVNVRFRRRAPGVINIKKLAESLVAAPGTNIGASVNSAEFALEMLRFPFRQVFGASTAENPTMDPGHPDSFIATLKVKDMVDRFGLASRVLEVQP